MEFKDNFHDTIPTREGSINRIRLEFKVQIQCCGFYRGLGINRIRLEFKDYTEGFEYVDNAVLIESDWNLKYNTMSQDWSGDQY